MNAAFSEEMTTQAWKSQSMQPTVSGQASIQSAPAGVSQAGAVPVSNSIRAPVYGSHLSSHTGPRWQPPTVPQAGLPPQGGPPDLLVPSGPWISIRPLSSGSVTSSASPTPQDSSGGNVPTVPSTPPTATAAGSEINQNLGLAVMTAGIGPQLPATAGQSGIPGNAGSGSLAPSGSGIPVPPVPSQHTGNSESSGPPAPPGVSSMSNLASASSHISSAVSISTAQVSMSAGSHGTSLPYGQRLPGEATVQPPRPIPSSSASPASSSMPGAGTTTVNSNLQLSQYTPYINVPPVPVPASPWMFPSQTGGQIPARPIPAFTIPNPYLPSIRPIAPLQAGIVNKLSSESTGLLAPPGELVISSKSSSTEVDKMPFASSVSEHDANVYPTLSSTTDSEKSMINSTTDVHLLKEDAVDAWTAHKTSEGIVYYFNSNTGESTYEKPPGFRGEVDKVAAQPTPVSCEMIGGTGWALVTTNDSKKYYYHTVTQATSWQVPIEVLEYRKKHAEDVAAKSSISKGVSDKGAISSSLNVTGGGNVLREGQKVVAQAASSALDLIKKKLQDSGASDSGLDGNSNRVLDSETIKDKAKESNAEKSSSESSSDSDEEEQGPTKDERIAQFREMLKEKGIAPFSKWEKELPKILFDPRFKAIPSHTERRSIFEHYVRTRAEEERKERRAAQKAAIEGFKQLLDEASQDINHNTDYEKFAKLWATDPRFEALDRKERETLLNERVLPLRKAEEERVRSIRDAAAAGFKAMLKEMGDVTSSSRWSRVKDKLRNDHRYRSVNRDEREYLFNSYVAELKAVEQEAERKAKAKREEEEKLRERERELRKRKEREEQELEKIRAKVRKREAVTAYQALLTEKIKDPEASWTESKPKLEKDGLGRATNPELDASEREKLFREHVQSLFERCAREYKNLLAETMTADAAKKQNEEGKTILNSWSEAKKLLKSDPRYSKMPRRDRESWWRRFSDDMQHKLKLLSAKDEKSSGSDGKSGAVDVSKQNSSYR